MTDLQDILARLRLLEDERKILQTLHRYGHSIDYGEEEVWVDCFTEDGVFDARYSPSKAETAFRSVVMRGRKELAAFVAQHPRAPKVLHKHLLIEPLIEVSGDAAQVSSYFEMLLAQNGTREIFAFGRYIDTMVRCVDEKWRFTQRIAEIQSSGTAFPAES